ncbi:protein O-mannosyl-transferase TMTC4 isoform X2 [Parasteatoda tepidariorum]|uniref:protein O-mannosyl-transferase TMTC4 isoform X2 n=1 Tax=Parasteatoda tepidariorum TaxID=114398 RepID=UPI00077FBB2B|nr:protein O-mannosyl-transferase TMTC4 isoform X2 [Parasteatoda tepidariorum]
MTESIQKKSWDDPLPVPTSLLPWSSFIVFLCAVICFSNSIEGEFVFDDSEAVINNFDLKPDTPLSSIFQNDFWGTKLTHNTSHKSYRPLTVLTFRLNHFITGLNPWSFHFVNILLHGSVSALFHKVISCMLNSALDDESPKTAFLSALLFSVHPVHTESVSAVVGRADLLCGIFFLLSFLSFIHASKCFSFHWGPKMSLVWVGFSVILAGLAMLCKEQGITIIGVCCIYDIIIFYKWDIRCTGSNITHRNKNVPTSPGSDSKQCISFFLLRQSVLCLGGIFLLSVRWYIMGASTPVFQQVDNPASFEDRILIVNYHYIYSINLWLLFHPYWLCFDWSMGCIPLINSFIDKRIVVVVIFWIFCAHLLYSVFTHVDLRIRRLLCLSLAFILVPFLPASNLFFRVGFVVAERVLYLPSMGFCLLVVIGLKQLMIFCGQNYQMCIQCSVFILLTAFGVRCIHRSLDWRNEETLFKSGLSVCPLNAKVHYNIAKNAADKGDKETAIIGYKEAIRLNPLYDQAMNNLANILKDQGELIEAEELLISAIKIRPDFAAAWMNLGIVQSSLKKMNNAKKSYLMALQFRKRYPDCYYNLGNLYLEQKQYDEAYRAWRNATAMQPTHLVAWNNMIIMLDSIGALSKAEMVAYEALQYLPTEASLYFNLANTLGKAGKYTESEKYFLKALQLNENNPTYHINLGVLYHRWKKYHLAEKSYKRALEIKPDMKSASDNLRLLHKTFNFV